MNWLLLTFFVYILTAIYYRHKRIPQNINGSPSEYLIPGDQAHFLYDLTEYSKNGKKAEQIIFSSTRDAIQKAQKIILFDIFLFNKQKYQPQKQLPVTDIIINELEKKNIPCVFITDPLNTSYSTEEAKPLIALEKIGVKVVFTDLNKLPDNNTLYSPFWRLFFQWFKTSGKGHLPNPLSPPQKTTLRAVLKGLNGKANHRKLLVADEKVIVSSSNLHDSSSFYSNTGLLVESREIANHFLKAELALAKLSGKKLNLQLLPEKPKTEQASAIKARPLMGKQIKKQILSDLKDLKKNEEVVIGMLFLSDHKIINLLKKKSQEGVKITVILDNNQVSFGQKKSGLPNLYLAPELKKAGIQVRIFNDLENEYHAKFLFVKKDNKAILNTGSANLTRRSLSGTNLENNLWLTGASNLPVFQETENYIKKASNPNLSHDFQEEPRLSFLGYFWVRIAEFWGFASW